MGRAYRWQSRRPLLTPRGHETVFKKVWLCAVSRYAVAGGGLPPGHSAGWTDQNKRVVFNDYQHTVQISRFCSGRDLHGVTGAGGRLTIRAGVLAD